MMKVRASQICMGMGLVFFAVFVYQIVLMRTDWTLALCAIGFSLVLGLLGIAFEWMSDIDTAFLHMTKTLAENIQQLVAMNRFLANNKGTVNLTISPSVVQWPTDERLDLLTLEELEKKLKEAEASELYERAAKIQREIASRKLR